MEQAPTITREILEGLIIGKIKEQRSSYVLDLSYMALTSEELIIILEIIYEHMPNITNLNLGTNKLKFIPESITLLKYLLELDLFDNCITIIPSFISELNQLIHLNLNDNDLISIEYESLMGCEFLEILTMDNNYNLAYIDPRIFDLPALLFIGIPNTKISKESKEYLCDLAKYLMTSTSIVKIYWTPNMSDMSENIRKFELL